MLRLALVAAVASLAAAHVEEARPDAPIVVRGTATLKAFDVTKQCKWDNGAAALKVGCTVYGSYSGRPGAGGAGYGWVWFLPKNSIGVTTHRGSERGTLLLDFGARGALTLSLTGRQKAVGAQTTAHAKIRTTGTWKVTEATASFSGAHGTGRYVYTVERKGSPTVFSLARLTLSAGAPVA
jgi:hypothetical protein